MSLQSIKGHIATITILDPDVAAQAAINFATYMPKLDMDVAEPIIYMTLHDTTDGGTTAATEFNPLSDRVDSVTPGATEYGIADFDTIHIGVATNTGGHTYRLNITAFWNFIQNT